jgi:hypothetical protein
MTLFDAPRTFISLRINMTNMVLEHVGGATRHCIHNILLCFFLLLTGFYLMWFGHCGFLEMTKLACGDQARSICGGMHHNGALRTGSKLAHVLCRHVVPGVGSVGSPGFYAVHCNSENHIDTNINEDSSLLCNQ